MGRWSHSNRTEADHLKKVEIWWLKKYGYLDGWRSGGIEWKNSWSDTKSSIGISVSTINGEDYIRFQYTQTGDTGEKQDFDYKARITTTNCNYGGKRYWFICPLSKDGVYCGKRVGVLYKKGDYFGCRHCYNLTYSSNKQNRHGKFYHLFRIMDEGDKVEKIQENMKRYYYAGKPTKKLKRILKINNNLRPYAELLSREK